MKRPVRGSKAWYAREWSRALRSGLRSEELTLELATLSYENASLRKRLAKLEAELERVWSRFEEAETVSELTHVRLNEVLSKVGTVERLVVPEGRARSRPN